MTARSEPVVRRCHAADGDAAARTLASAFARDPMLTWLTGQPDAEQRSHHLFGSTLANDLAKPHHLIDVIDDADARGDMAAVAVWYDVDQWRTPKRDAAKGLPAAVRAFRGRLPTVLRAVAMIEKAHPEAPHRYLEFLGVHQSQQGRGLGSALLKSATERCDTEGLAAYLENSNPLNEPLYARYGFQDRGLVTLPPGAPPFQAMWREPR